jgi:hypothetical protein
VADKQGAGEPSRTPSLTASSKPNVGHIVTLAAAIAGAHASTKGIGNMSPASLAEIANIASDLESFIRLAR